MAGKRIYYEVKPGERIENHVAVQYGWDVWRRGGRRKTRFCPGVTRGRTPAIQWARTLCAKIEARGGTWELVVFNQHGGIRERRTGPRSSDPRYRKG